MKRIATRIASALLTFILGTAGSLWHRHRIPQSSPPPITVAKSATNTPLATPIAPAPPVPAHEPNLVFGRGLKLVSHELQIKNELLRYKVSVTYPQIDGTDAFPIRKLNKHIERLVQNDYQWLLNPAPEDLRYYKGGHWADVFNSTNLDYEVVLATDSFLSIYFESFSYGISAAHAVQYSFVVNYDLDSNRLLTLSDIFKPGSTHLKFISEYCIDQLSRDEHGEFVRKDELAPRAGNFESWNMTREGIRFNFDECKVFSCAAGEKTVQIPFTALRPIMSIR